LIIFGLILCYLSFVDFKKLSINGWDLTLIGTYTAVNFLIHIQRFGIGYLFDGIKALLLSVTFFSIVIIVTRRNGIGFGDMLFFGIASINVGFTNAFEALIFAFSIGAIVALILITTGKLNFKERTPFIPFLSFGICLSLFLDFVYI